MYSNRESPSGAVLSLYLWLGPHIVGNDCIWKANIPPTLFHLPSLNSQQPMILCINHKTIKINGKMKVFNFEETSEQSLLSPPPFRGPTARGRAGETASGIASMSKPGIRARFFREKTENPLQFPNLFAMLQKNIKSISRSKMIEKRLFGA
jgi:hypothetical protein